MEGLYMKGIGITPLDQKPEYAAILAHWSYLEWYMARDIDFDNNLKAYQKRAEGGAIPCSFVATSDTMPVGMVSLKENDLWSRKDLNPWLASLFVIPEFRNRGVAEILVNRVVEKAGELSLKRIYLFLGPAEVHDLEAYYSSRGWEFFDNAVDNDGKNTKIFCYNVLK